MKLNNPVKLLLAIGISELAGVVGSIFTVSAIPGWYSTLIRPPLNPPPWIFGPVWTSLYLLMGVAAFLVWKEGMGRKEVKLAIYLFSFQLILNSVWSILFFGLYNPFLAFIDIVALWFAILFTMLAFYKVSKLSMYLLVPYILWVSFASYLNLAIWYLNK